MQSCGESGMTEFHFSGAGAILDDFCSIQFSFWLMPFGIFQNAMPLAMLEEAACGNAGTQPVKEYSGNRPKKSERSVSAFSDFFRMFPSLKKFRGLSLRSGIGCLPEALSCLNHGARSNNYSSDARQ